MLRGDASGAELVDVSDPLRSRREVLEYIQNNAEGDVVVAVDAPLVICNPFGQRPCETMVGQKYGARHASCHTSNLQLYPNASSVQLASNLMKAGFVHAPDASSSPRVMLEVYPHAALVALFDLPKIIKYKTGRIAQKQAGLRELQRYIANLAYLNPPLQASEVGTQLLTIDPTGLRGSALKQLEDALDAVVCAYVGFSYWCDGKAHTEVFGDTASGYIVNPKLRSLQQPRVPSA